MVAPGFAASTHASCISATTRPARRITAIWSGVFRSTIDSRAAAGFDDFDEALEHVVAFADSAHLGEHVALGGSSR